MSDYLWDKSGEPEEDVAQLENLLGALKYQPRPLEIPASAMPAQATARTTTMRPAMIFSRPRLALAASLLLTLLAGAWFLSTRQGEHKPGQLARVEQGSPAAGSEKPDKAVVSNAGTDRNAPADKSEQAKRREDKAVAVVVAVASAAKPRRPSRQSVARRGKLIPREKEYVPAPREEVAGQGAMRWQVEQPLTPQQREATEKLMLALRLASAKFNYAQREMLEIGRAGN
ncbi:MAG TPA: hypothetical protein VGX24_03630 [Pyrinomonadaceae bacterium]|jgi:hypothetical protein|nr:hypothetical protein [Pyrinomonadaceae bacterium]